MKNLMLLELDLRLFGGGTVGIPVSGHGDAGTGVVQNPALDDLEAKRKAYRDLIEGEYREQYLENIRQLGKQRSEDRVRNLLARLRKENPEVKEVYPDFDLREELKDRSFLELIHAGVPLKLAYELKHLDEIKAAAARNAAQQMTARMKSRAARPSENGTASQSAVSVKSDVSKLNSAERAEIARRVARGESIVF